MEPLEELIKELIKSVDAAKEDYEKTTKEHLKRLDEIKVALEKQNLFGMSAGSVVNRHDCDLHNKKIKEHVDSKLKAQDLKIRWAWIVGTFVLLIFAGAIGLDTQ